MIPIVYKRFQMFAEDYVEAAKKEVHNVFGNPLPGKCIHFAPSSMSLRNAAPVLSLAFVAYGCPVYIELTHPVTGKQVPVMCDGEILQVDGARLEDLREMTRAGRGIFRSGDTWLVMGGTVGFPDNLHPVIRAENINDICKWLN